MLYISQLVAGQRSPSSMVLDKSGYLYDPNDTSCDGFPKLQVETYPGTCLGLVIARSEAIDKATDKEFIKPRTIIEIPSRPGEFIVADMGGWNPGNGRLFWLKKFNGKKYGIKLIKMGLDTPHGLRYPGDGYFYVGEKTRIIRFKFLDGNYSNEQVVVDNLPGFEGHMHPLTQFVFDPRNMDLYINSGAPSDKCFAAGSGAYKYCPETFSSGLGAIYRIPGDHIKKVGQPHFKIRNYEIAGQGLRNSMAMVVHPSGKLLQAENSMDLPEFEEPYEELNVIDLADDKRGGHYGWPYCYNFHATSPDWEFPENAGSPMHQKFQKPVDCNLELPSAPGDYHRPYLLLPPHAAPLGMNYYNGSMFQDLFGGDLVISYHGHQPSGNRLVSFSVGNDGLPILNNQIDDAHFNVDSDSGCPTQMKFDPRGGMVNTAEYKELISGWNSIPGIRPEGSPVGFTVAADGSIFIVEDRKARVILRLAKVDPSETHFDNCSANKEKFVPKSIQYLANRHAHELDANLKSKYLNIQKSYVDQYCMNCHGNPDLKIDEIANDEYSRLDYFIQNDWISHGLPEESKLYGSIAHFGEFTPMPPLSDAIDNPYGTTLWQETVDELYLYLSTLEENTPTSAELLVIDGNRNIRDMPTTSGSTVCGKFIDSDRIYVAGGSLGGEIRANGWIWRKVFLVPNHSRLFQNRCSGVNHPKDGVFYVAIKRI